MPRPPLAESFWNVDQSWNLESLHEVNGHRVQIRVCRANGIDNSYAESRVWSDALASWQVIQRVPGPAGLSVCGVFAGIPSILYVERTLTPEQRELFDQDRQGLLNYAARVLRNPLEYRRQ